MPKGEAMIRHLVFVLLLAMGIAIADWVADLRGSESQKEKS